MSKVEASTNPILVDAGAGETSGSTTIHYQKDFLDELWHRQPPTGWLEVPVHQLTNQGDEAEREGEYQIALKPGRTYEIGVYQEGHGPLTLDPIPTASLTVFCVSKTGKRALITDTNQDSGGTWHWHKVHTYLPTKAIVFGVSRKVPSIDVNGIPSLVDGEGALIPPLFTSSDHEAEIKPLLPGQHYHFVALVTDSFGNWDYRQAEFNTLRRKLTVQFNTLHIFNDGDPSAHGEGEFWFRVSKGAPYHGTIVEQFHTPTQDIDDWGETDRPYSLGFAHLGNPESVAPEDRDVTVMSIGIEHDGSLESDENAWSPDTALPLQAGRFVETAKNQSFMMDCPVVTVDDDFHYGVDVQWSVEYVP